MQLSVQEVADIGFATSGLESACIFRSGGVRFWKPYSCKVSPVVPLLWLNYYTFRLWGTPWQWRSTVSVSLLESFKGKSGAVPGPEALSGSLPPLEPLVPQRSSSGLKLGMELKMSSRTHPASGPKNRETGRIRFRRVRFQELSEFFGPRRVPGRELSELLSAY